MRGRLDGALQIGKQPRNEIAEAIKRQGFDPADFTPEEGDQYLALRQKSSGSRLVVQDGVSTRYIVTLGVGKGQPHAYQTDELSNPTLQWLRELQLDLQTPDLWAEIGREPQMAQLMEGTSNDPFTPQELSAISGWAEEVKRQSALTGDQKQLLEAKLDYLVDAAKRTGRIDWLNAAVGVLGGWFAGAVLPPEIARSTVHLLFGLLGHAFGVPMSQLPG
jgi:hypothetical protein